jgi:hypothetical protein
MALFQEPDFQIARETNARPLGMVDKQTEYSKQLGIHESLQEMVRRLLNEPFDDLAGKMASVDI